MAIRFSASQSVEIGIFDEIIPIKLYLRKPERVVNALIDPARVQKINQETYRFQILPLGFLNQTIQPTVDIKIWAEPNGTIRLKSLSCKLSGLEYISQRFNFKLEGYLSPTKVNNVTFLEGKADLQVEVELPAPLLFTPRPLLETAGNNLLKGVLGTMKKRLLNHLLADYHKWAKSYMDNSGLKENTEITA
jgi:hypothetical protein